MLHTRNVLVAAQWCRDGGLVGEYDFVVQVGGEQALKQSDGGVEDDGALNTSLDSDLDLAVVDEIRADALDVRWRRAVEVSRAKMGAKLVGLDLRHVNMRGSPTI